MLPIRVCNTLQAFYQLGDMKWLPDAWQEYLRFNGSPRSA
jgi:hypothetical protein